MAPIPRSPRPWHDLLHPTRSLRARLGLFFGALSLTLAILLAFTLGNRARWYAERNTAETLSSASAHMAYLLGNWLGERYDDIHVLALLPPISDPNTPRDRDHILREYRRNYQGYLWIGLLDQEGQILASTGPDPGRPAVPPTTQPYIGSVRPLAGDGRVLDLVVPVTSPDGRTWGKLWAMLDWHLAEDVRTTLESTLPPGQQEIVVVTRPDGTVLLGPPSLPDHLPPTIMETRDPGVAEVETWPDGRSYLSAAITAHPQGNAPDVPFVVIARQPTDLAFAPARHTEWTTAVGGIAVGLAFALLGWALAARIARPLTEIATSAERMRAGETDVQIPPVRTSDEVGTLADSLRKLIAELRATQSELALARDDAESANRAKDRFLAVLSHELRTPLTPILIALSQIKTDGLPADLRHDLEMIRRNADLEARLIDDLLDTTRIASGKLRLERQTVDVHAVLRWAIDTCLPAARAKSVALVCHAEADRHHASADPARLEQIFWNLIKNAVKFTPHGGTITVRTRNNDDGGGGDRIVIDVRDTGIGIPAESLPLIFRPFEQGDPRITRQFGGLGLGLAISRSLAESHGGSLTASSPGRDQGSTFTVTLPTVPSPVETPAPSPHPAAAPAAHPSLDILLVEDHPDTAHLLARLLRARGHKVTTAGSVSDALAAADDHSFDLVISDLGLPDGSGADVMRRLRSTQPRPPRGIAVSGYGTDADKQLTREAGFEAHLTKPIKLTDLELLLRPPR